LGLSTWISRLSGQVALDDFAQITLKNYQRKDASFATSRTTHILRIEDTVANAPRSCGGGLNTKIQGSLRSEPLQPRQ
jgi:hypothetical protein